MIKRLLVAILAIVFTLTATGCAGYSADVDETVIEQEGYLMFKTDKKLAACHSKGKSGYGGVGNDMFNYPAGQRTFSFTGTSSEAEMDPVPVVVVSALETMVHACVAGDADEPERHAPSVVGNARRRLKHSQQGVMVGPRYAELPNGLKVILLPDPSTDLVEVDVRYAVGSNEDPEGKAGLAHLVVVLADLSADLPPGANALLKVRAEALRKGDSGDADELREELSRLGVVVREEKKRQYWRLTRPLP